MSQHPHALSQFCMHCGCGLVSAVPAGDRSSRLVCSSCGFVHYINPRPVAGTIPVRDGRVLLVRRSIEPRLGAWVFPGGFIDVGETVEEAAIRETHEEANLRVANLRLLGVYTRTEPGVIVIVYEADAISDASAGQETSEVAWFEAADIPWDELAFDSTVAALRDWAARLG
jgi:ADP-ribose pyrophosphatase YjhB (NUDIX family)